MGSELSGVVESVGSHVVKFKQGDAVFAYTGMRVGKHAEYIAFSQDDVITTIPNGSTYTEAAAIAFGGTTALHFCEEAVYSKGSRC